MNNGMETVKTRPLKSRLILSVLLVAATAAVFWPVLGNGFTNWDDPGLVLENPLIRDLSFKGLARIFETFSVWGLYHPLTLLAYGLVYKIYALNPFGYHLASLLLHLASCLVVFRIMLAWGLSDRGAFLTALLFGIHPMHVETVAWVSELKGALSGFLFLSSLLFYLRHLADDSRGYYAASLGLFLASMLAKPFALMMPVLLFFTDHAKNRGLTGKSILNKLPYFLVSLLFGVLALITQRRDNAVGAVGLDTLGDSILLACQGLVFYVYKIALPFSLSSFYPVPQPQGQALSRVFYLVLASGLVLGIAAAYIRKMGKGLGIWGLTFFGLLILPVLKIVPFGQAMAADRYVYIPILGLITVAAWAARKLYPGSAAGRTLRAAVTLAGILYFSSLGWMTFQRCRVWKDSVSLWSDVLRSYPSADIAYNNRGNAYQAKGLYDPALADYRKALEINPGYKSIYLNRGNLFNATKKYTLAIADYDRALLIDSGYVEAYNSRGAAYGALNQFDLAIQDFERAVSLDVNNAEAHNNLGIAYYYSKDYHSARIHLDQAKELGYGVNPYLLKEIHSR
ncbi:MAG: tetratricopeptide repeat protein [bacterium]|nr:tetratricopeptide repeat protein [bacterium]